MCGFVGFFGGHTFKLSGWFDLGNNTLQEMSRLLSHRGPDANGIWINSQDSFAISHQRLSILDISPAGNQPMVSILGRYVLVFNGEIYNHQDLRTELNKLPVYEKKNWLGHSDTETLLSSIEAWGLEKALQKSIGMFAFALWDKQEKRLFLARDRFGEKPLYFGWQGNDANKSFLFGSELKALKAHPAFSAKVDRGSLSLLLRHNYIPAPYSIYEGISKLEPGSFLSVSLSQPDPVITKYWDAIKAATAAKTASFTGTPQQAVDDLEILVKNAVSKQMMADVPLGAFLSGGIDSSTIVALMQSQSSQPVKTFTIGFNEEDFNEAVHAKAVAKHLGTEHTELYVSPTETMDVIPKLPSMYCEPFADSSQIPTYLVSQLAKQKVTVSLSGDAGDELFCGYNRYKLTAQLWRRLSLMPTPMRGIASKLITSIPPNVWDRLGRIIPEGKGYAALGDKMHKGASILTSANFQELYLSMVSQIPNPAEWVLGGSEPPTKLIGNSPLLNEFSDVEQMMLLDTISYLPDDILVKVDRAAMGVSLEGRVPFLDHRIFEFAWTLPLDYKLRDGQTKWPLRQLLYRYVPKELIERPKMGFGVPISDWLRGPLRGWAETLLSENRLRQEGYFHPEIIRSKWAEHLSGRRNWQSQLWTILMFQAWLENEK
jgi:asparagine synthase (glutamine-hydrolysing)